MAGKEFKAKARTVQKMSRDGLVEENLRTGKKRKVRAAADTGERIGDRPMEEYSEGRSSITVADDDRHLRFNRGSDAGGLPGEVRVTDGTREAADEYGAVSDGTKKRRMAVKRESSYKEAPSSLEKAGGEADGAWNEEFKSDGAASGTRLKNARYAAALRKERGSDTGRISGDGRRMVEGSDDARLIGADDKGIEGEVPEGKRKRLRSVFHKTAGTEKAVDQETSGRLLHKDPIPEESGLSEEESAEDLVSQQSKRMQRIRGHPSGTARQAARSAAEIRHARTKKQVYDYAASERKKESRLKETVEEAVDLSDAKEEILGKQKKERLNQEQRKIRGKSRLSFDDGNGMVQGSGMGFGRKARVTIKDAAFGAAGKAAGAAGFAAHAKLSEAEDENVGTQAAHGAEMAAEDSVRRLSSRRLRRQSRKAKATRRKAEEAGVNRLVFAKEEGTRTAKAAKIEADKKTTIKKFFQKQRQRRMYAAAKKEEKTVETLIKTQQNLVTKAAVVVKEAFVRNSKVFMILGLMGVFFLLISASLTSCTALMQGAGSSVVGTTYPSTDEDIYAVENRYRELEAALNAQINAMRSAHPEYDDFRYQIDEISQQEMSKVTGSLGLPAGLF